MMDDRDRQNFHRWLGSLNLDDVADVLGMLAHAAGAFDPSARVYALRSAAALRQAGVAIRDLRWPTPTDPTTEPGRAAVIPDPPSDPVLPRSG